VSGKIAGRGCMNGKNCRVRVICAVLITLLSHLELHNFVRHPPRLEALKVSECVKSIAFKSIPGNPRSGRRHFSTIDHLIVIIIFAPLLSTHTPNNVTTSSHPQNPNLLASKTLKQYTRHAFTPPTASPPPTLAVPITHDKFMPTLFGAGGALS
jgi:hypothetical protein